SALPWPALPDKDKGSLLLERYAFGLVPHGPFLLEHLRFPSPPKSKGLVVAVGDVAYDDAPRPLQRPADVPTRAADTSGLKLSWTALQATGKEVDGVLKLAQGLKPPPEPRPLRGPEAGTAQLLQALPRARWAHLATHGFFAAPRTQERKHLLDERDF